MAVLAGVLVIPETTRAECVQQMSRMPISGPAAGGAPAYRANMMRRGPVAAPAANPARPRAMKAKATGVRKARPVRKATAKRPHRKPAAGIRRAAAAPAIAPVLRQPTPMPVAARELATPRAFALIASTVCETGAQALGAPDAGVPVLAIAPAPGGEPIDAFTPGPDTQPSTPGLDFPIGFPGGGGPGLFPVTPPGEETPIIEPPVVGPPVTEPPVVEPPITEPPTTEPPVTEPPVGPPGVEPPVFPPFEPPIVGPPPVTPVPEPSTWAMMILGFGLLGMRLRATSSSASGSRGRARPRG